MASTPDRPYRNKRSTANSSMDSILDDTISPRISMDWRTALDRIPDGADPFADELDHTQWTVSKAEDTDHTYTDATRSNDVKVIGAIAPFLDTRVVSPAPEYDSKRISYILPSKESYAPSSPTSSGSRSRKSGITVTKRRLIVLILVVAIFVLCLTLGLLLTRQKREESKSESSTESEDSGIPSISSQQSYTNNTPDSLISPTSAVAQAGSNSTVIIPAEVLTITQSANGATTVIEASPEQITETVMNSVGAEVVTTRVTVRQSVRPSLAISSPAPIQTTTQAAQPASASPSPASRTPQGSISSPDRADIMETYDYWRPRHGAVKLSWSDTLANRAQLLAEGCQIESSNFATGDLVASGADAQTAYRAAQAFYYHPENVSRNSPSNFAQFVWQATTSIGCGSHECSSGTVYVCSHSPAGNVAGSFSNNVDWVQAY